MNLTTKREIIRRVPAHWRQTYTPFQKWDDSKGKIAKELDRINVETATEDDIERIIGNRSWTRMTCDECKKEVDALIQVGEPPDYESRTAQLCPECVRAAFSLANNADDQRPPRGL